MSPKDREFWLLAMWLWWGGRSSFPFGDHLPLFSSLPDTTQMNNAVPTSPLLQQMGHPHSYPSLGQISNPYEQQPPGKELNKYASLKAVGKGCFVLSFSPTFLHISNLFFSSPFSVFLVSIYLFIYQASIISLSNLSIALSPCLFLSVSFSPSLSHMYILGLSTWDTVD